MATNYNKYINSTGTHYISNTGHDENGKSYGGKAGDQGGEYTLRSWYNRPWSVVLRWPDPSVGLVIARLAIDAALNDHIGYDQHQRNTYWTDLVKANYDPSKITVNCETDCTESTTANCKAAGYILGIQSLKDLPIDTYSGNMKSRFIKAGFTALAAKKYLTSPNYLLPGDVLLYEGHHACINITYGKDASKAIPTYKLGDRTLRNGMTGADVKELQTDLIKLGYDLGKWGADGDFGDCTELAVKAFQRDSGLTPDGVVGKKTVAALEAAIEAAEDAADQPVPVARVVVIEGGDCYVRTAPNTSGRIIGVAKRGEKYVWQGVTSDNGWQLIGYGDGMGYVSGKYARLEA